MENEKKEEIKKENKLNSLQNHIGLQVVIFFVTLLFFFIISVLLKAIVIGLESDSQIDDIEEQIIECSKSIEYLINDINSETEGTSQTFQGISTLAYSISARILIINTDYSVEYDSFYLMTDTYMIDDDVHAIMNGNGSGSMVRDERTIKYIFPVINREGYTDDVVIMAVSLEEYNDAILYMSYRINIVLCIFAVLAVICALLISALATSDVRKIRKELVTVKDGFLGQIEVNNVWREAHDLTDNINAIFAKAETLEESRQEFVSNVSHELKTPITSMKVLSESILTQENVPVETYREFMNDIVLEIDREAQIISDLLTLVKTDKGAESLNIENVDINELMEIILKRLMPLAEKRNIEITFESFREVFADIDKVKFTLAVSNLIENAIKYNIDGGWIKVSLNADHKNLYIKVADSGVGIPEDCIEHIFERFYRVDKARSRDTGGTGLGLAISKNIIVMHKGTINVYSEPGKGTTFTVRVPMNYIK